MSLIHDKQHMAGLVVSVSLRTTLPASVRLRYCVGSRDKNLKNTCIPSKMASIHRLIFIKLEGFTSLLF